MKEKKDEYLYRLLCFDEKICCGFYLKDICLKISFKEYIERGSRGIKLWFIFCCKIISGLEKLVSYINEFYFVCFVVCINIMKFDFRNVNVIDLIDESVWLKYFKSS